MDIKVLDVVFFLPSLDGGIGRVTYLLAKGLHEKGKKVEVWSAKPKSGYGDELEKILQVRYIGTGNVRSSFFKLLLQLRKSPTSNLISASFHANCISLTASIFSQKSTKFIIADHPSLDSALKELSTIKRILWKTLILLLYPIANKHVAVSKGVASAMSKYSKIKYSKINIIPNPVITEDIFFKSSVKIKHSFFDLKEPVILFVGRLSKEKDLPNLIYAFKKVQEKIASRLLIVGDGPDRKKLQKLVDNENLNTRISFLGHKKNPYPYFTKSDLFVLSSTREGLPTVIIEALAFGLKIVSTDCQSGPREILNNGKYGRLVEQSNSVALSNSIVLSLKSTKPIIPKTIFNKYKVESAVYLYTKLLDQ